MKPRPLFLMPVALLALAGCVAPPEKAAGPVIETDAPLEAPVHVGSHIRSATPRKSSAEATAKMSGEEFRQQQAASRLDATGEQIINARNEGR